MANYKDALFKIETHKIYEEGSKEYNIKSNLATKCLSKFQNVSLDVPLYVSYLLLYEVNGLVKVDWNKFLTIDATPVNTEALSKAAKETIISIEQYNPDATKRICKDLRFHRFQDTKKVSDTQQE